MTVTLDRYGHLFPKLDEALTARLDELRRSVLGGSSTSSTADRPSPPVPSRPRSPSCLAGFPRGPRFRWVQPPS